MKRMLAASFVSALLASGAAFAAADPAVREKLIVEGTVVQLKDGSTIVLDKGGKTYHANAAGKRVRMKDGAVMEGKDGRKYLHKNDVVWQQISEKGTMAPNR